MGRYYYGEGKNSTDDYLKRLTIKGLKLFLNNKKNFQSGTYSWKGNGNIGVEVDKGETNGFLRVHFTQTSHDGEKKYLDYKIPLVSTPCNYGGIRWWFLCPCKGNRCSILYKQNNGIFASRKTLDLCYPEQKESKRSRYMGYLMGRPFNNMYLLKDKIKYQFRNGKPTRKMRRFLKLHSQMPSIEEVKNISSLFGRK